VSAKKAKPKKAAKRGVPRMRDEHLQALPVLALNGIAVLPSSYFQFQVDAPRAVAVVEWCLRHTHQWLAVAGLAPEYHVDDGTTPLVPVFAACALVDARPTDDGSYEIIVLGTDRVRFAEALAPDGDVRRIRVERAESVDADPKATRAAADRLRSYIRRMAAAQPDISGSLRRMIDDTSPSALVDSAAGIFVGSLVTRLELLETLDVGRRFEVVLDATARRLLELAGGGSAH
jgi:ATP-dependent Lon protease